MPATLKPSDWEVVDESLPLRNAEGDGEGEGRSRVRGEKKETANQRALVSNQKSNVRGHRRNGTDEMRGAGSWRGSPCT